MFDPDETSSPQEGIYVVYIYSAELDRVVLTLNQGVGRLRQNFGDSEARKRLAADAAAVRKALGPLVDGTTADVSFGVAGSLQRAYEAGNIAAIEYVVGSLPDEPTMVADLSRFADLYQAAIAAKRELLQTDPGSISSSSAPKTTTQGSPPRFRTQGRQ